MNLLHINFALTVCLVILCNTFSLNYYSLQHDECKTLYFYQNDSISKQRYSECMIDIGTSSINNTRFVITSSDTSHYNYLFFIPLTTLVWSRTQNYYPITFLIVSNQTRSGKDQIVLNFIREKVFEAGGISYMINNYKSSKYRDATISQVVRLFAMNLPFNDDDYILTSDADMWPLSKRHFNVLHSNNSLAILYHNAYKSEMKMYPICYLGAKIKVWREIMGKEENILQSTYKSLENASNEFPMMENWKVGSKQWFFDQYLMFERVKKWGGPIHAENRFPWKDRVDRIRWPAFPYSESFINQVKSNEKVDAHILRPGDTKENWIRLRGLLEILLDPKDMQWVDQYYKKWNEIK